MIFNCIKERHRISTALLREMKSPIVSVKELKISTVEVRQIEISSVLVLKREEDLNYIWEIESKTSTVSDSLLTGPLDRSCSVVTMAIYTIIKEIENTGPELFHAKGGGTKSP